MNSIKEFFILAVEKGIISIQEKDKLVDLFKENYPNRDIYKNEVINELMSKYNNYYNSSSNSVDLNKVFSPSEAAEIYGVSKFTIQQKLNKGAFTKEEARKSHGTWLLSEDGLNRFWGDKRYELIDNMEDCKNEK
ncbi:MAG: helix-turn-helix domain-containing protein [Clostridium paraputrificum]|uniref:helix-turn-helix domain-containing protein n=1 Tax=Clostridium sp. TaxID=1506 RepID=UPI0025C26FEE|nr:helix-turn-helix domain-containing protein [Clostridium sp.]MBS5926156.1 hypothetical protein [Clostridium sp.]